MNKLLVLLVAVIMLCTAYSYGDQIVIESIDAEDGMMRSNEDTYEDDRLRIGD